MERSILAIQVRRASDVVFVARRARLVAVQLGVDSKQARGFEDAVRTIADTVLKQGGGGSFRLILASDSASHRLEAIVTASCPALLEMPVLDAAPSSADGRGASQLVPNLPACGQFTAREFSHGEAEVRIALDLPPQLPILGEVFAHWVAPLRRIRDSSALETALRHISLLGRQLAASTGREKQMRAELVTLQTRHEPLSLLAVVASKTDSAVIVMDRHARVEWVNTGFVRLTGYTPAEVAGAYPFDFLHGPQTDPEATGEIAQAFDAAEGQSQELLHYRKGGGTYWASLSITPVFDEEGMLSRWICIFSDITKRYEAQSALERAREAAEAASRAKSEFLANMSHEIRTPMNAFIGMTELALLTELTQEQREYLVIAKESAESLLRLLNEILDLSKIEAGKIEIDCIEFNLPDLVEDTMKALSVRAKQKGLELVWQPPREIKQIVVGDPVRLRQILINLVDNAIKFTDQGTITVCVEPQWQTDDEVGLGFSVTDTGIGIPANEQDRIFEGFTQGDSSTTRRFGGTGLGLTISSHLVQLMQGEISVESEVGQGSTFRFSLRFGIPPRRGAMGDHAEPPRPVTAPDLALSDPPRVLHVLVADDNAANRVLAERILQKRGHRTESAKNGQQVIAALSNQRFDVVLMDVQMPEMDGFATTNAIRQMEQYAGCHIPVIAMTAYAMKGDRERCLAAGMDGYLAKPLRARELVALVESMTEWELNRTVPSPTSAVPAADGRFAPALARVEGDPEILREQMEFFLRDYPAIIAEINRAAKNQDGRSLERAAHRIKGLAAGFDAVELVESARRLEESAGNLDFHDSLALCGNVAAMAAVLQQDIESYLQRQCLGGA
ncbi:MAG: ATP-binding protein [Patescibacteria group bacterium]|nr:ATP-binding protein [Patescibacteria group bacterium]